MLLWNIFTTFTANESKHCQASCYRIFIIVFIILTTSYIHCTIWIPAFWKQYYVPCFSILHYRVNQNQNSVIQNTKILRGLHPLAKIHITLGAIFEKEFFQCSLFNKIICLNYDALGILLLFYCYITNLSNCKDK